MTFKEADGRTTTKSFPRLPTLPLHLNTNVNTNRVSRRARRIEQYNVDVNLTSYCSDMPANSSQKVRRHWSKNVRDVSIAHDSLHIRIEGGAENGEFLHVEGFTSAKIKYRKGRLTPGDILIELNDEPVVGLTLHDLMNRVNKAGKKVNFKVVQPGGGISKDMRDYLSQKFPDNNEVDLDLQDVIRDNLYARTVPCTTRAPRSREEPGIDYIFLSKEKFKEMEENGDFLESGTYNGHYYGTLKPKLYRNLMEQQSTMDQHTKSPATPSKINHSATNKKEGNNNADVTIHRKKDVMNERGSDVEEEGVSRSGTSKELEQDKTSRGNNDPREDDVSNDTKELGKSESLKDDKPENHFTCV